MNVAVLNPSSVSSVRRRKPMHTYQSPAPAERQPSLVKSLSTLSNSIACTSKPSRLPSTDYPTTNVFANRTGSTGKKYPMAPPLPLYHPLGRLALSLPPLEPSSFGHSPQITVDDSDAVRRSSARSRRPAAKLREAEEDEPPSRPAPISNVSAIAAVAAREIKEKASPRKKRAGGGAGSKRKRKDVDDGDATYPAKRTRNPRGAGNAPAEDGSPTDSGVPLPEVTPTPEPMGELQEDSKKPERRATRSSGGSKRRDSSASEATSASASAAGRGASKVNGVEAVHAEAAPEPDTRHAEAEPKEAKEEGEVSEEAP
ncbi:hypothetical protein B0H10DRAFT_541757 [Mycena sp. CBHHK59/15]|nr:hypothetical protein B0H10DRAFT_541757 [Mycena sp. CBHHK59/15]